MKFDRHLHDTHHLVISTDASSCDFDRHILMISSSCDFDRHILMILSSCDFDRHTFMILSSCGLIMVNHNPSNGANVTKTFQNESVRTYCLFLETRLGRNMINTARYACNIVFCFSIDTTSRLCLRQTHHRCPYTCI